MIVLYLTTLTDYPTQMEEGDHIPAVCVKMNAKDVNYRESICAKEESFDVREFWCNRKKCFGQLDFQKADGT